MDLSALKAFAAVLEVLGVTEAQIQAWLTADGAAHPDRAGIEQRFQAWLASMVTPENVTAVAHAAVSALVNLVQTGKGPISEETDPTTFG